jgi:hypothetical protein
MGCDGSEGPSTCVDSKCLCMFKGQQHLIQSWTDLTLIFSFPMISSNIFGATQFSGPIDCIFHQQNRRGHVRLVIPRSFSSSSCMASVLIDGFLPSCYSRRNSLKEDKKDTIQKSTSSVTCWGGCG